MRIGIDLGGTTVKLGVVDDTYTVIDSASFDTIINSDYRLLADEIAKHTAEIMKKYPIEFVGIGCPGTVTKDGKTVISATNIDWDMVPISDYLSEKLGVPVIAENDASVAALGELLFGGYPKDIDLFFITIGTGVGGGYIKNGRLFSGATSSAMEFGHLLRRKDGRPCSCGRAGCLEQYASFTALIRDVKEAGLGDLNGKEIFDLKRSGNPIASDLVDNFIREIADAICDVENIFEPDVVLIGGGLSNEGEYILAPIRDYIKNVAYSRDFRLPKIHTATAKNKAGIIGAANLVSFK